MRVRVRPRGGYLYYSDEEFKEMLAIIEKKKQIDAEGIVIGMVHQGKVDERIKQMIQCAESLKVTFHRAFEMVENKVNAYRLLANLGVDSILSTTLPEILSLPQNPMQIRLGGCVDAKTIKELTPLGFTKYHLGKAVRVKNSYDRPIDINLINNLFIDLNV